MAGLSIEDMTNIERFEAYVKLLIDLTPTKVFSLRGIKMKHSGSDEMNKWIKDATRKKYSLPPVKLLVPTSTDAPTQENSQE
jgi:hypothetical protein